MSSGQKQLKCGPSGSSPLRSDDFRNGLAGRLDHHEAVAKVTKTKLHLKGAFRLESTQIRWFS
jgi:hypothetical protein